MEHEEQVCCECGDPCDDIICDKCNKKIAEEMAEQLRQELDERRRENQEGENNG